MLTSEPWEGEQIGQRLSCVCLVRAPGWQRPCHVQTVSSVFHGSFYHRPWKGVQRRENWEQHGWSWKWAHKTLASLTLAGTVHMATASGNQFFACKKRGRGFCWIGKVLQHYLSLAEGMMHSRPSINICWMGHVHITFQVCICFYNVAQDNHNTSYFAGKFQVMVGILWNCGQDAVNRHLYTFFLDVEYLLLSFYQILLYFHSTSFPWAHKNLDLSETEMY